MNDASQRNPELVLLLSKPAVFEIGGMQNAVAEAFGVILTAEGQDDSISGAFPEFEVKLKGKRLRVLSSLFPYFDPRCRAWVSGDPDVIRRSVTDPAFRKAIAEHKGWISVSLLNAAETPDNKDAYRSVAKMLSAFAHESATALVWPDAQEIVPWEKGMQKSLAKGTWRQQFRGFA